MYDFEPSPIDLRRMTVETDDGYFIRQKPRPVIDYDNFDGEDESSRRTSVQKEPADVAASGEPTEE